MLATTITVAAFGLLAWPVEAGSRHWEGSSPLTGRSSNGTMEVFRRAISFQPSGGESGHYTWPDKKIKYCFADATAKQKLRGHLEEAMQTTWGALRDHGFSYEEVDLAKCDKDRINHLKIHYNADGKFSTSIGKQPIDEKWNRENPDDQVLGPTMHLSTKADVGMLDTVANVAHELGHAWGLYHEHQNPNFWTSSFEDQFPSDPNAPKWPSLNGNSPIFAPSQFDCEALEDYSDALQRAQELAAKGGEYAGIVNTFCTILSHASKVKFSAKDWLPLGQGVPVIADATFDPKSIMLYPSAAGGRRPGNNPDGRQNVLTLAGGALVEPNVTPTGQDIERLRVLYSVNIAGIQELHIRGAKKSTFDKLKKKIPKFGSAKDKTC